MTDKKKILFGIEDDEKRLLLSKMCDIAQRSEHSFKAIFSRFLNPGERLLIEERLSGDFAVSFFGGYDDAQRTVACFGESKDIAPFPICAVKIEPKGKKELNHRDYLGSVLSLGIKREHIGDILVKDGFALMFVTEEIKDFIMLNLSRIASQSVKLTEVTDLSGFEIKAEFKESSATVSSMRLDCVLSAVTGKSRSQSASVIEEGLCSVNYSVAKNVRLIVKDGDIISLRGFGKTVVETDGALTKKGRIHINFKKYI
jgi:RNA-binding protein YlmH